METTTQKSDQHKWQAAVAAAMPFMRKQYAAKPGADKFAVSRAKHEAISHATALASAISVDRTAIRNPERAEVKAAIKAYDNA